MSERSVDKIRPGYGNKKGSFGAGGVANRNRLGSGNNRYSKPYLGNSRRVNYG